MPYANDWDRPVEEVSLEPQDLADWFRHRGGWQKGRARLRLSTPWSKKTELKLIYNKFRKRWGLRPYITWPNAGRLKNSRARLVFTPEDSQTLIQTLKSRLGSDPSKWKEK